MDEPNTWLFWLVIVNGLSFITVAHVYVEDVMGSTIFLSLSIGWLLVTAAKNASKVKPNHGICGGLILICTSTTSN